VLEERRESPAIVLKLRMLNWIERRYGALGGYFMEKLPLPARALRSNYLTRPFRYAGTR
jgi:hypothetical protein